MTSWIMVGWLVALLGVGVLARGLGVVLATRLLKSPVALRRGLLVALCWSALDLAVRGGLTLLPARGLRVALASVSAVTAVWISAKLLDLRVWRALGVTVLSAIIGLAIMVPVVAVGRMFIVSTYRMPPKSVSMRPNIEPGEWVAVDRLAYRLRQPRRWEAVVVNLPIEDRPGSTIKRIVGLPGERIEFRRGRIVVNGQPLEPPRGVQIGYQHNLGEHGKQGQAYTVPPACYYVIGDASEKSFDSRFLGCVPRQQVVGRVIRITRPGRQPIAPGTAAPAPTRP